MALLIEVFSVVNQINQFVAFNDLWVKLWVSAIINLLLTFGSLFTFFIVICCLIRYKSGIQKLSDPSFFTVSLGVDTKLEISIHANLCGFSKVSYHLFD
jgi:hypothetical protein